MTEPTNAVDDRHPDANMYGCLPCPKCGAKYRFPTSAEDPDTPSSIVCDDCGFIESRAIPSEGERP